MAALAKVPDSNASVPEAPVQEIGFPIVPSRFNLNSKAMQDGVDITPGEVNWWFRTYKPPRSVLPAGSVLVEDKRFLVWMRDRWFG